MFLKVVYVKLLFLGVLLRWITTKLSNKNIEKFKAFQLKILLYQFLKNFVVNHDKPFADD